MNRPLPKRNPARRARLAVVALLALPLALPPVPAAARPPEAAPDPTADARHLLAEHLAQLGQSIVATRAITPETLDQSIALLRGALRLNPDEPRFARLLAEAALQDGDTDVALEAYRALTKIDPHDRVAQMRVIELYAAQMETADARLAYLEKVAAADTVAAEVRSHAALLASRIHFERAETTEGTAALEESLRLSPLNPAALKAKYELSGGAGTPRDRAALLLQMLRSNPSQPGVMAKLANECADVALHEQALNWYNGALQLAQAVGGRGVEPQDYNRYIAQLAITGNAGGASGVAAQLLEADRRNVDAAFVMLILQRRGGDADQLAKAQSIAEQALLQRALNVGQQLRGEPVTTQPAEEQQVQVDVPGDIKRLQEAGDPALTAEYASTLADLAWLRVYFNEKPQEAAQVISQLRQLLPPDSVTVARLEGWQYLMAGQRDEARVKLSAVADRDPLAQLGMIRLTEQDDPARATEDARRLMNENPSGTLGVIIHDALRDKKEKLPAGQQPPLSEDAQQVKGELDAFPREWLDFIDPGKANRFYLLRADPLKVGHAYGEPMIVRVTVRNTGKYDITVGPDGAIRPDLWFDVQLRGVINQQLQGVAFDRLTQQSVLKPEEQIVQTVRVDQRDLAGILAQHPAASLPLFFSVLTNPLTNPGGFIAPGPGGQRQSFFRPVNRNGMQVDPKAFQQTMREQLRQLNDGKPAERMRAMEAVAWFGVNLAQREEREAQLLAGDALGALRRASNDPEPALRAWGGFTVARAAANPEARRRFIEEMLGDPSWEPRLVGAVLAAQTTDAAQWKQLLGPLAQDDPDPVVKEFAAAVVRFADNPASTQPTTQPAEGEQPVAAP
jgi:hypothetical protein